MAVVVLVEFNVRPEAVTQMTALLRSILPDTRAYAGCLGIDVHTSDEEAALFVFVEHWASREHYDKYLAWRTSSGTMDDFGQMLAGPPKFRFLSRVDA